MSDERSAADQELGDAVESIRGVGENLNGNTDVPDPESDEAARKDPSPSLPDWGTDGVAAEDEPSR